MAITIQTAYAGEVLEKLLVKATTGNELVQRGLIHVVPNVQKAFYIPRLKLGEILQKRKEQPDDGDSKGTFTIDEKKLEPQEFMAFTTFNPRSFETFWRKFQPQGNLVFEELPAEAQTAFLEELAKRVDFELGWHFINGKQGSGAAEFFNGILTRILADNDVVKADLTNVSTMINRFKAVFNKIPKALRGKPGLKFLCSIEDADAYDDELIALPNKGADPTSTNAKRYKGIPIEPLADWPQGTIIATVATNDLNSNLWAGVSLVDDYNCVQIDKLTNAGEKYFFKMLMKADTNIAFGELVAIATWRLSVATTTVAEFTANGGTKTVNVTAPVDDWTCAVDNSADWFTVAKKSDNTGITVTATAQETGAEARTGSFKVSLYGTFPVTVNVSQAAGASE